MTKFESLLSDFTGSKYAIAVSNGTVALRLSLYLAGVRANDEVIIPPLTFVATANAVSHLGAHPHFIDIDRKTLGICPIALNNRLEEISEFKNGILFNKYTGRKISAIIPVHIFGNPAKITLIKKIADKWKIPIIEDAAEALGSWILNSNKKIHCGLMLYCGLMERKTRLKFRNISYHPMLKR